MDNCKFWTVYEPLGKAPRARFPSLEQAMKKDDDLVKRYPGHVFTVMEAVKQVRAIQFEWADLDKAPATAELCSSISYPPFVDDDDDDEVED